MFDFFSHNTCLSMSNLLLFILATMGLTNILVHGKILDVIGLRQWLRNHLPKDWFEVLECYECTGFWSGLLCGILIITYNPLILLACGWAGSLCSQTFTDVIYMIRSKTEYEVGDEERTK